jgi:pyrroline-5-carboxylate reductase
LAVSAKKSSRLAVIGAGKMGGILLQALLAEKFVTPSQVQATVKHAEKAARRPRELGIAVSTDNRAAVEKSDIILLAVKPQSVPEVLEEVRPQLDESKLLISIVASVPTAYIEKRLAPGVPVVRAMPNTPALVRTGMTALCRGAAARDTHLQAAERLFAAVGQTLVLDEKHMDAVTALSASGPAYLYIILESLAEAGVKVGLPRDLATTLAAHTMLGAARMVIDTGDHPALLKDAVTTPAGCTIDGILELEEGKLRVTLIKAVVKACLRARELLFAD